MILTYETRTYPGIVLRSPLTRGELIERIYREGQRLVGQIKLPLDSFFELAGTEECEAKIVERFVGDARIHPGSLLHFPSDATRPDGLVLWVEVHVDIDDLGVDWDHIDDDTPDSVSSDDPVTRSFHHHTSHSIGHPSDR